MYMFLVVTIKKIFHSPCLILTGICISYVLVDFFWGGGGLLLKIKIQIFLIGYTTMNVAYNAKTECRKVCSSLLSKKVENVGYTA